MKKLSDATIPIPYSMDNVQMQTFLDPNILTVDLDKGNEFPSYQSNWMVQLIAKFIQLTNLPVGWDGYDAAPITFEVAKFSADLVELLCQNDIIAPSVVPGSDGSIQLEWHRRKLDLEIKIVAPNKIVALKFDQLTDVEEELQLDCDFARLEKWISELNRNVE